MKESHRPPYIIVHGEHMPGNAILETTGRRTGLVEQGRERLVDVGDDAGQGQVVGAVPRARDAPRHAPRLALRARAGRVGCGRAAWRRASQRGRLGRPGAIDGPSPRTFSRAPVVLMPVPERKSNSLAITVGASVAAFRAISTCAPSRT